MSAPGGGAWRPQGPPRQGSPRPPYNQQQQNVRPQGQPRFTGPRAPFNPQQQQQNRPGAYTPRQGGPSQQQRPSQGQFQRSGPPQSRQLSQMTTQMSQLTISEPGRRVPLLVNLFHILVNCGKGQPIFKYAAEISFVEDSSSTSSKGPRRIPKHLRVAAMKKAVDNWIKQNKPKADYYVHDSAGSTMITQFEVKTPHSQIVSIPDDAIRDNKLVKEQIKFEVKFASGEMLDLKKLIDHYMKNSLKDFDLSQEVLRIINIIMNGTVIGNPRFIVSQSKSVSALYSLDPREQFSLNAGVQCNRGAALAPRAIEGGLALNVANTVVPFFKREKMVTVISSPPYRFDVNRKLSDFQIDQLDRDFKMVQVEMFLKNFGTVEKPHFRKYRISSIGGSIKDKFEMKDKDGKKTTISVEDYFLKEYGQRPKNANLPCIISNGRKIPLEFCQLEDKQRVSRKMKPDETAEVIKNAALKPDKYFQQVQEKANMLGNSPVLDKFGIQLKCEPIEVEGRELPSIELVAGRGAQALARGGQYDLRDIFYTATKIKKWALIAIRDRDTQGPQFQQAAATFGRMYCEHARRKGIEITEMENQVFMLPEKESDRPDDHILRADFRKLFIYLNEKKFEFGIILLPNGKDWLYGYIQYCETSRDITKSRGNGEKCTRTACIKLDNFKRKIIGDSRGGTMFLGNLMLKHNVKLGGVNVVLKPDQKFGLKSLSANFLSDGYLFISIDVCHPAPGDKFMQSVAAMVGMWDITNPKISHSTRLRVQLKQKADDNSTVEKVLEVGDMFKQILQQYKMKKNKPPTSVVILRDGVSQGQFEMVIKYELQKIKGIIASDAKGAKITCFTVQKRHKVRFMRKQPVEDRKGPDYNIQPGTVVDKTITHPNMPNFFIAPHKAIQGTAIAPHIFMLVNEIGFNKDSAQAMIHALSYLSPRCTKGTSIPTPVNLADLAAERGKNIIIAWKNDKDPKGKMKEDEYLPQLNAYLAKLGDQTYSETLYYI